MAEDEDASGVDPPRVVLRKYKNLLDVTADGRLPLDAAGEAVLIPRLEYNRVVQLVGRAVRIDRMTGETIRIDVYPQRLYRHDDRGRLICGAGWVDTAAQLYEEAGYEVQYRDLTKREPGTLTPEWDRLKGRPEFRRLKGDKASLASLLEAQGKVDSTDDAQVALSRRVMQREVLDAVVGRVAHGLNGVIQVPPGFGKAQPLDSAIQTPQGPKRMGDIRVGDRVCTPRGTTTVVAVHPQGLKKVYRVTFEDDDAVECCAEHLWKVSGRDQRPGESRLVDTSYLLANHLAYDGSPNFSVETPKPLRMRRLDAEGPSIFPPYIMGLLLGDGGPPHELLFRDEPWREESGEKFIPKVYLYECVPFRWELLRGLMDTDGEVGREGEGIYRTSSPRLRDDVKWLVESLGGVCRVQPEQASRGLLYRLIVTLRDVANAFHLARNKLAAIRTRAKCPSGRTIARVEQVGVKVCRCITVAAKDGLYLTDHCVVTHNSYTLAAFMLLFPKARIDIVVPDVGNANKTWRHLTRYSPDVGMIGGGGKTHGRVTVFVSKSLHHARLDADLVFVDEVHKAMANDTATRLGVVTAGTAQHPGPICFGLSATPTGRRDGTDARLEGLFGPIIYKMLWPEATRLGLVAPIRVEWLPMGPEAAPPPLSKEEAERERNHPDYLNLRKRRLLWCNEARNAKIAARAMAVPAGEQVLILVEKIEHAVVLRKLLPSFELVYGAHDAAKFLKYERRGDVCADFEPMTPALRESRRIAFEEGTLRRVIANDVWSTGVSFDALSVMIRADGRASSILDEQIPGRVSRSHATKPSALVVDCDDRFDKGLHMASMARRRNYKEKEWRQIRPDDAPRR